MIWIIITYLIISFFGWLVHWSIHQPWMGKFYHQHMTHHLKLYPPTDYFSDTYRKAGQDDTAKTFILAFLPLLSLPIVAYFLHYFSLIQTIIIISEMLLFGWLNDYIHEVFHLNNSFLKKLPILKHLIRKWNKLHYIHHCEQDKNFGIFHFLWDRIFRTFKED